LLFLAAYPSVVDKVYQTIAVDVSKSRPRSPYLSAAIWKGGVYEGIFVHPLPLLRYAPFITTTKINNR
jgi:hypothetical protein